MSDIDIAIFSPDFEGGTEKDCLLLDRVAGKINPFIEAVPFRSKEFVKTVKILTGWVSKMRKIAHF